MFRQSAVSREFRDPLLLLKGIDPEPVPISISAVDDRDRRQLLDVLRGDQLEFVFQPIVDLHKSAIFGYKALMRGPLGTCLHTPASLLTTARRLGYLVELECQAALSAIRAYGRSELGERLFVNLSAPAILALAADCGTHLFKVAVESGVAPSNLMFELTEHERVEDPEGLQSALEVFKNQGVGLALDDFGDGRSSLRLWAQLQPDIVKLDKYFVTGINRDSRRVDIFRALADLAQRIGSLLVAEGVEHPDELAVLRDLGCVYALASEHGEARGTDPKTMSPRRRTACRGLMVFKCSAPPAMGYPHLEAGNAGVAGKIPRLIAQRVDPPVTAATAFCP